MERVLGIRKIDVIHTESAGGKNTSYRVVLPDVILKKLNLLYDSYIILKKKDGDTIQLIKAIGIFMEERHQSLDVRKIMSKNRIALSTMIISFLGIEDGDYLMFIELKKGDIRLRKLRKNEKIMEKILGIRKVSKKVSEYKSRLYDCEVYRIIIPTSVLERLGLSYQQYVAFKNRSNSVQLINVATTLTEEISGFMGLKQIGTKNRISIPSTIIAFLNIAEGDCLKFVELKKGDIRLRKLRKNEKKGGE